MVKVKGVNIYPGQIEDILRDIPGVSSEYQINIDHIDGKDVLTLSVEMETGADADAAEKAIGAAFKTKVGLAIAPKGVAMGSLPRSEKKTKRIFDYRNN